MSFAPQLGTPLRRGFVGAALVIAGLGIASIRTAYLGAEAADSADAAFDRGELVESIRWARRAASLNVPGAEHVGRAYFRLEVIARGAEAAGEAQLSVAAWEAIRSAAIESRSPLSTERPELERANQNLARLRARLAAERQPGVRDDAAAHGLLTQLESRERRAISAALLPIGFALSVAGLLWAAFRHQPDGGRRVSRHLLIGLLVTAIGVACWTLAVYTA